MPRLPGMPRTIAILAAVAPRIRQGIVASAAR